MTEIAASGDGSPAVTGERRGGRRAARARASRSVCAGPATPRSRPRSSRRGCGGSAASASWPSSLACRSWSTRPRAPVSARRWPTCGVTSPSERDRDRGHRAGAAAFRDARSGGPRDAPVRRLRRRRRVSAGRRGGAVARPGVSRRGRRDVDRRPSARAPFARRAWSFFGLEGGVEVDVREAIPPHSGLGSGTKLGLAIARGLAGAGGHPGRTRAAGRGERARGALERRLAGHSRRRGWWSRPACADDGADQPGRGASPDARALAVRARAARSASRGCRATPRSGSSASCTRLRAPSRAVARLLLTALLPGLLTGDIDEFGARADRDPARDWFDLRGASGRRVPSARGSAGRRAVGPRRRRGRPELVGADRVRDRRRPRAGRRRGRAGSGRRRAPTPTSAWSTSIAAGRGCPGSRAGAA